MRKKLFLVVAVLAIVACIAIFWMMLPPKEPVYKGKPLSFWLSADDLSSNSPSQEEAATAFRAMGSNAIPTLLLFLERRDHSFAQRMQELMQRQHLFRVNWKHHEAFEDVMAATAAFQAIGPQSVDVLPELTRIYDLNPSVWSRQSIMAVIRYVAPHDERAVPLLLRGLADTNDPFLRHDAAFALGELEERKDLIVPALTRALEDPEPIVKESAMEALAKCGSDARPAVPALVKLLQTLKVPENARHFEPGIISKGAGAGFVFMNTAYYNTNRAAFTGPSDHDLYIVAKDALWTIDPAFVPKAK